MDVRFFTAYVGVYVRAHRRIRLKFGACLYRGPYSLVTSRMAFRLGITFKWLTVRAAARCRIRASVVPPADNVSRARARFALRPLTFHGMRHVRSMPEEDRRPVPLVDTNMNEKCNGKKRLCDNWLIPSGFHRCRRLVGRWFTQNPRLEQLTEKNLVDLLRKGCFSFLRLVGGRQAPANPLKRSSLASYQPG